MADAGRVIAGTARGIRLEAPGPGTRPLADRVKQTLFAILEPDLPGARVLDLFAGSGAAGIEALSRGAASATFVEHDAGAAKVIAANLRAPASADRTRSVVRDDAAALVAPRRRRAVRRRRRRPALRPDGCAAGGAGGRGSAGAPGGRVVAKHFWRDAAAGADRPASIRARPPLRRDRADVLPAPGGSMRLAVYPGSFDPITNGHVDVIRAGQRRVRPARRRGPRQPAQDAAPAGRHRASGSSAPRSRPNRSMPSASRSPRSTG